MPLDRKKITAVPAWFRSIQWFRVHGQIVQTVSIRKTRKQHNGRTESDASTPTNKQQFVLFCNNHHHRGIRFLNWIQYNHIVATAIRRASYQRLRTASWAFRTIVANSLKNGNATPSTYFSLSFVTPQHHIRFVANIFIVTSSGQTTPHKKYNASNNNENS